MMFPFFKIFHGETLIFDGSSPSISHHRPLLRAVFRPTRALVVPQGELHFLAIGGPWPVHAPEDEDGHSVQGPFPRRLSGWVKQWGFNGIQCWLQWIE